MASPSVIAIADAPIQPEISTDYRPYYAVAVMHLTAKGDPKNPLSFIRTLLTENTAIPKHAPGETHTGKIDSYNRIDSAGNHHRKSPGVVHDEAVKILTEVLERILSAEQKHPIL